MSNILQSPLGVGSEVEVYMSCCQPFSIVYKRMLASLSPGDGPAFIACSSRFENVHWLCTKTHRQLNRLWRTLNGNVTTYHMRRMQ